MPLGRAGSTSTSSKGSTGQGCRSETEVERSCGLAIDHELELRGFLGGSSSGFAPCRSILSTYSAACKVRSLRMMGPTANLRLSSGFNPAVVAWPLAAKGAAEWPGSNWRGAPIRRTWTRSLPNRLGATWKRPAGKMGATSASCSSGPRATASARLRSLANSSRKASISSLRSATQPSAASTNPSTPSDLAERAWAVTQNTASVPLLWPRSRCEEEFPDNTSPPECAARMHGCYAARACVAKGRRRDAGTPPVHDR